MKIQLSQNAPVEVFPFVTSLHREVVLRHLDGDAQDIEMTLDEADAVAAALKEAAAWARTCTANNPEAAKTKET